MQSGSRGGTDPNNELGESCVAYFQLKLGFEMYSSSMAQPGNHHDENPMKYWQHTSNKI